MLLLILHGKSHFLLFVTEEVGVRMLMPVSGLTPLPLPLF